MYSYISKCIFYILFIFTRRDDLKEFLHFLTFCLFRFLHTHTTHTSHTHIFFTLFDVLFVSLSIFSVDALIWFPCTVPSAQTSSSSCRTPSSSSESLSGDSSPSHSCIKLSGTPTPGSTYLQLTQPRTRARVLTYTTHTMPTLSWTYFEKTYSVKITKYVGRCTWKHNTHPHTISNF